jgi:hypothetical protein
MHVTYETEAFSASSSRALSDLSSRAAETLKKPLGAAMTAM